MPKQPGESVQKWKISWEEIDKFANSLAKTLRDRVKDKCVIMGIANGGIIPAVLLAKRLLDKHPYLTIHRSVGVNKWPRHPDWKEDERSTYILVDDIADSGDTMQGSLDSLGIAFGNKNVILATFYKRMHKCPDLPNHVYAVPLCTDEWIVFPWEVDE